MQGGSVALAYVQRHISRSKVLDHRSRCLVHQLLGQTKSTIWPLHRLQWLTKYFVFNFNNMRFSTRYYSVLYRSVKTMNIFTQVHCQLAGYCLLPHIPLPSMEERNGASCNFTGWFTADRQPSQQWLCNSVSPGWQNYFTALDIYA